MKACNLLARWMAAALVLAAAGCSRPVRPQPGVGAGLAAQTVLAGAPGACLVIAPAQVGAGLQAQVDEFTRALAGAGGGWKLLGPVAPEPPAPDAEGNLPEFVTATAPALLAAVQPHRDAETVVSFISQLPLEDARVVDWLKGRKALVVVNVLPPQVDQLRRLLPDAILIGVTGNGFAVLPRS